MPLCDTRHCDLEPEGNSFQFPTLAGAKPKQAPKLLCGCLQALSQLETLICPPAQIYQLHFNLDPGKWGLIRLECVREAVSAANQHVLSVVLCAAEETVTTIIHIHSMPVEMSAKRAAARSASPRPAVLLRFPQLFTSPPHVTVCIQIRPD